MLKSLDGPTQVMLYLIKKNENVDSFVSFDDVNGSKKITTMINAMANNSNMGYKLKSNLYKLATMPINCNVKDLGISILLLSFGKMYNCEYSLFVHFFKHILEIEYIEQFILYGKQKSDTLDLNILGKDNMIIIDEKYGIMAQFNDHKIKCGIKLNDFILFSDLYKYGLKRDNFIQFAKKYDIDIVFSLYTLITAYKSVDLVKNCKGFSLNKLNYKFKNFTITSTYKFEDENDVYWCTLPTSIIMFAYCDGEIKVSNYINMETYNEMKRFDSLKKIVVGFIHQNVIKVLYIDDVLFGTRWSSNFKYLSDMKIDHEFLPQNKYKPKNKTRLIYVIDNNPYIFKCV